MKFIINFFKDVVEEAKKLHFPSWKETYITTIITLVTIVIFSLTILLADFLISGKMVNGYSDTKTIQFNGMGCLAAQLIAYFKHTVGGFYIHAVTDTDCCQEYEYHVYEDRVVVKDPTAVIFEGDYQSFTEFCTKE